MKEKQQIAIYLRLSVEDTVSDTENKIIQDESSSISGQRKLLLEYIRKDAELSKCEVAEFCDDGFSGINMERPGMQKLLECVKRDRIGCILVKDLSRFSRDYMELGTYLNRIFPFLGVRFLAVNDHYDSREHVGTTIAIDTAFRTLLYDLYSKDISVKVKSSIQNKCLNGEYAFGQVPFGYKKSKEIKNAVVVNEQEAGIVRYIFSLADKGMSTTQIAKRLFEEQIPTATQIRQPERRPEKEHLTWSAAMVRSILKNRFYLGEMVYGKSMRNAVGNKKRTLVPESEWKTIPNHHPPLVTQEVFSRVSASREGQLSQKKREKHPLTGKIFCGGCGYSMNYKVSSQTKGYRHFWCGKHALLQIPECCTCFHAAVLEEIVLTQLCWEVMRRGNLLKQKEYLEQFQKTMLERANRQQQEYNRKCCDLQAEKELLYEKYAERQVDAAQYRLRVDELDGQMEDLSDGMAEVKEEYCRTEREYDQEKRDMKQIIRCSHMTDLTQEMVDVFIKKIIVYKNNRVVIEWNYAEEG